MLHNKCAYRLHFHTRIDQENDKIEFKLESNMPVANFIKIK